MDIVHHWKHIDATALAMLKSTKMAYSLEVGQETSLRDPVSSPVPMKEGAPAAPRHLFSLSY